MLGRPCSGYELQRVGTLGRQRALCITAVVEQPGSRLAQLKCKQHSLESFQLAEGAT